MRQEFEGGLDVVRSGETAQGAQRFADGAGRHGEPA
jgi:enoyl-CoA hydratase